LDFSFRVYDKNEGVVSEDKWSLNEMRTIRGKIELAKIDLKAVDLKIS
jgi:hypothetical protein